MKKFFVCCAVFICLPFIISFPIYFCAFFTYMAWILVGLYCCLYVHVVAKLLDCFGCDLFKCLSSCSNSCSCLDRFRKDEFSKNTTDAIVSVVMAYFVAIFFNCIFVGIYFAMVGLFSGHMWIVMYGKYMFYSVCDDDNFIDFNRDESWMILVVWLNWIL